MKKFYLFLVAAILISSCKVAEKEFRKGNYDEAIDICVKRLIKNPDNEEYILLLEEAFKRANGEEVATIKSLNTEGRPDRWEEIYMIYQSISRRQHKIEPLMPLYLGNLERDAVFDFVNVVDGIATAKKNAAAYWYADAKQKLATGDKYQARDAYNNLVKIKSFYATYQDTDKMLAAAKSLGTNEVVFVINDKSDKSLSSYVREKLYALEPGCTSGTWYQFMDHVQNDSIDYTVQLNVYFLEAYPEKVSTNRYEETKQVEDGFTYVYDDQGNMVKDSLGNAIKVPVYKTITATVTETWQEKVATVKGEVTYLDKNRKIMRSIPVQADGIFQNYYAVATGYYEALTQQSKAKLGGKPLPFPADDALTIDALESFERLMQNVMADYNDEYLNQ